MEKFDLRDGNGNLIYKDTDWKLVAEQRAEQINELEDKRATLAQANADLAHMLGTAERHCATYVSTLEQREEEIFALKAELVDFESGKLRAEPILGEGDGPLTVTLNINLDTAKDRR